MAQNVVVPPLDVAPQTVVGSTPQANFAFNFPFWQPSDLLVYVGDTLLTAIDYTVTGQFVQNGQPVEGGYGSGIVTLNTPVSNVTVTIDRFVKADRETQFSRSAPLSMPVLNADLNKGTARDQDLARRMRGIQAGMLDPDVVQQAVEDAAAGVVGALARRDASNLSSSDVAAWNAKLGSASGSLGYWNATTNSPVITSSVGVEGAYYTVIVAGTTEIDGVSDWDVGDRIIFTNGAWVKSGGVTTSTLFTTLEEHGGKANDATFDNAPAFAAAEAFLTAKMAAEAGFKGVLRLRGGVDYYFKDTLLMKRRGGAWIGERTRLIYNGASTTKDLIVFGHYNGGESLTGKPQTRDVYVEGLQILSATNMTAGCAVRTRSCIESVFKFELQTQTGYESLGNNLYNGLWNEWSSTCCYEGVSYVAKNKAVLVNGAPGLAGGKSDVWFDIGKIGGAQLGMHIGGAFGGIWCQGRTTFISNKKHVLIDQALTAENNREVMFKGTTFDYTAINNGVDPGDVGIDVADASEVFIDITDCWIAGAHGAHLIVRATSSAFINCSGNRWFFGKPHPTDPDLLGHAIVTDSATSRIFVSGGQANSFPGIVFRSRIEDHNLNFADVHPWNCPAGVYDVNFVSTTDTTFRAVSGATWARSGWFDNNVLVGPKTDQNFYLRRDGVDPIVNFDVDDYLKYFKSLNRLDVSIGGAKPLRVTSAGISIAESPVIYPILVEGTTDGSGNAGGTLSIPQVRVMASFILVEGGAVGGYSRAIQVQANGSNWQAIGDANSASKPYHGLIWVRMP